VVVVVVAIILVIVINRLHVIPILCLVFLSKTDLFLPLQFYFYKQSEVSKIIILFSSLFLRANSRATIANYSLSTMIKQTNKQTKYCSNNNSIKFFIYLCADSTAIGLLQSQHGHIQQKE
jgi:hypothetical protein